MFGTNIVDVENKNYGHFSLWIRDCSLSAHEECNLNRVLFEMTKPVNKYIK